jgi:hypothetical protein
MAKKSTEIKSKSLFDHINEIREGKSENYYDELTEGEKKSFSQFVILIGLSMDKDCIDEIAVISKYVNIIPNKQFYKVCCDIIPYGKKFCKWIKNSKHKINKELIDTISLYYEIGTDEASEYCELMMIEESGITEICNILTKYGKSDKEIKAILK